MIQDCAGTFFEPQESGEEDNTEYRYRKTKTLQRFRAEESPTAMQEMRGRNHGMGAGGV